MEKSHAEQQDVKLNKEKKQEDYYIENGLLVFTEIYHLKRGKCCKNNCRHCPYKKPKIV